jgi:eukaryotic-like serine/threonine-protein kinase
MELTAPTSIGPYRIEREIGRGGMGVVFLARDTRLDRAAAIKALPDDVASDPERLQRFEREAKVLASLSHPNIAGIYGVEELDGRRYLALEYIEGESLAERLARGPLRLDETIEIAVQITAGIEAAHEGGIIHRDLKPGNVVITPGDHVKVVDFGLAKGRVAEMPMGDSPTTGQSPTYPQSPTIAQSPTLAHSPTVRSPATIPGVILGTAAYLSPEQARGKAVDRRTDIWAFGCLLYECLTGLQAFQGETVSDTIAKILERDVDWSRLPKRTPPRIRELLERCLEKDPKRRLRDIGDARLSLEEVKAGLGKPAAHEPARARVHRIRLSAVVGALVGLVAGALIVSLAGLDGRHPGRGPTRLSIAMPEGLRFITGDLTADGRAFVLLAQAKAGDEGGSRRRHLYLRRMDRATVDPIRGSEDAQSLMLSPDGKWVAFVAPVSENSTQRRLLKVPIDGSAPPIMLSNWDDAWSTGGVWLRSGDFLLTTDRGKRYIRLPAGGNAPGPPQGFNAAGFDGSFSFGRLLPGDRGVFLEATSYEAGAYRVGIGVLDLKSGKTELLIREGGSPRYASTGHLLFTRSDKLLAVPFDAGKLETRGQPVAILDGLRVATSWVNAGIDWSENGTLVYAPGGDVSRGRHAVVVDPKGSTVEWSGEKQPFESAMSSSPEGSRFAAVIANANALYEIWISQRGGSISRRVVAETGADCSNPIWSRDGERIAYIRFARTSEDGIYAVRADGTGAPARIVSAGSEETTLVPTSYSPDGRTLLVMVVREGRPRLGWVPLTPAGAAVDSVRSLFSDGAMRALARFSPDGRLVAYLSDETGKPEVYVCPWGSDGPAGVPIQVSTGGGANAYWNGNGTRLYYATLQGDRVMSAGIQREPRLAAAPPAPAWDLEKLRVAGLLYDVLPDGNLLLIQKAEGEDDVGRLDVALGFDEELRARFRRGQ